MLNLIVAPTSECSNAENITKKIVKFLKTENVEYSVYFSTAFKDIKASVDELVSFGETEFIVVGNCSVFSEVLNSFKDISKIKFGFIPTTRNDDFAKYVELETSPILAVKNILDKKITELDYMVVNSKKVVNNVIIGASVEIFELQNQLKFKNIITEKFAEAKVKDEFAGVNLSIQQKNGKTKNLNVYEFVAANGGYSKGKLVSPLSNVTDGLFNLLYTEYTGEKTDLINLQKFSNGEHVYSEDVVQQWINNLKITNADKKIKAIVDGKIQTFESLEITLVEKGLKIYGIAR